MTIESRRRVRYQIRRFGSWRCWSSRFRVGKSVNAELQQSISQRVKFAAWFAAIALLGGANNPTSVVAQLRALDRPMMARPAIVMRGGVAAENAPVAQSNDKAILKTDADLEALLVKAQRYLEEGNFRIATRIWQEVIGRCGDTLYSTDGEIYYSVGRQVEKLIAQLPPDGLRTYRISADAGAAELLAALGPTDRTAALNRVVNEYFLSSGGDDAAFELSGQALDSFDFVGASRLLQRIVDDYPDPTVPLDQVWMRVAVCQAFVGNQDAAAIALKQAREMEGGATRQSIEHVANEIAAVAASESVSAARSDQFVSMRLGNAHRTGVMPSLPESVMQSDLKPVFEYRIEPKKSFSEVVHAQGLGQAAIGASIDKLPQSELERTLYNRWIEKGLAPTGFLLFDEQHVFYKSIADVTVWKRNEPTAEVIWRPAWLNQFIMDDGTRMRINLQNAYGGRRGGKRDEPGDDPEIFFFNDHIAQSMSLHQGVLYNVEGPNYDVTDPRAPRPSNPGNFQWGQLPRRTRTNFLTAYDARSGQLLWRMPSLQSTAANKSPDADADPDASRDAEDIGFMAAPIGYGSLLIVPVNVSGSIYIYAIDSRQQGKIVWRSYLTDEPAGGCAYWSPIHLALDGSDLFAVCGSGALFVLEPATGVVRFARRYPRTGRPDKTVRDFGISSELMILDGWSEDLAIPYRNVIIVMASDLNMIHAYDRQTGKLKWEAPLEAEPDSRVSYLIGIQDDLLYAGGTNELIAYDLKGEGRMIWTASWTARDYLKDDDAKSFGRGMITPDGIYLPIKDSILKMEPKTGKPLGHVGVRLGFEGRVGNLFSDGSKLWVVSANRLLALGNAPEEPPTDKEEPTEEDGEGSY